MTAERVQASAFQSRYNGGNPEHACRYLSINFPSGRRSPFLKPWRSRRYTKLAFPPPVRVRILSIAISGETYSAIISPIPNAIWPCLMSRMSRQARCKVFAPRVTVRPSSAITSLFAAGAGLNPARSIQTPKISTSKENNPIGRACQSGIVSHAKKAANDPASSDNTASTKAALRTGGLPSIIRGSVGILSSDTAFTF